MLENLKQMCQQEFFKRLPCDINLDNIIKEAKTYEDIEVNVLKTITGAIVQIDCL